MAHQKRLGTAGDQLQLQGPGPEMGKDVGKNEDTDHLSTFTQVALNSSSHLYLYNYSPACLSSDTIG